MVSVPARVDVVVIGAGQAGLSVAYYLQRLGVRPGVDQIVLDRGPGAGGAWQHRWAALRLGSAHRVHDLPGMRRAGISFETADRARPARDVVGEYYAHYERFFGLDVRRPVAVAAVYDRGSDLVVRSTAGETVARVVVNATGTWGAPFVPYYPGMRDFAGRQVHTSTYRDAAEFEGQRVLVVGGGTSAIGFLLELEGVAAKTTWAVRRPVDYLQQGTLDLEAAVNAVAQQDDAAREGRALPSIVSGTGVPLTRRIAAAMERGVLQERPMFGHLEAHAAVWADGWREPVDAIVWATGFRPDIRHLSPLRLHEKAGGVTVASGAAERDPRIFFAGYGPTASTVGANRAGRSLARQVYAALGGPTQPLEATADTIELADRIEVAPQREDPVAALMARFFTDA
ncbi:FAD-dependent oxidoreductase [Amnibacterium endophyticum]|uniref:FAD-dependent oxidoreductase n=1 Tax=Amnibacterium endophyticum TaxID=2109337 RepID=A0ABW4LD42_9MICO